MKSLWSPLIFFSIFTFNCWAFLAVQMILHLQAFKSMQSEIFYNYLQFEENQFMQSAMIAGKI